MDRGEKRPRECRHWSTYAAQLSQNTDFALLRKVSDLRIGQFDNSIASFEEYIAGNSDSPDLPEHVAQLEKLKEERDELLLDEAKKRVERNPTDLQVRFELGEVLRQPWQLSGCYLGTSRARQNPSVRVRAMNSGEVLYPSRNA